jgi:hypothetical protein
MYTVLVDLAGKHKRSVNGEIQYIIESGFEALGIAVVDRQEPEPPQSKRSA